MMKLGTFHGAALLLAGTFAAAAAFAQTASAPRRTHRPAASAPAPAPAETQAPTAAPAAGQAAPGPSAANLQLPNNPVFLGDTDTIRKATAIVNGSVITATDVDQRLALVVLANEGRVSPDQMQQLRAQVLRNLVDETLQIQAAEAADIKIEQSEIDTSYARFAQTQGKTPQQLTEFLRSVGSSAASIKRQIRGEMAWARLQQRKIEPFVNVSNEEVKSIIDRLNAQKGTQQFHVYEIFLAATPETAAQARANADRIVQQLRGGASFMAYARQFSEASTAAVGGDLGWIQPGELPQQLADAVRVLPVGTVSDPIAIPGGFSILTVQDTKQILTADPRDAVLSLKQLSITFPPNTQRADAEGKIQQLMQTTQSMGGCGGAEGAAAKIGAEVVSNDQVKVRDLPPALQNTLINLSVGQPTPPFGAVNDRISVLVLCGRDDPPAVSNVSYDQVYDQVAQARVNMRAQRYLRDLRRDAVIDYR
ncbi:MAG TPA: peptidylprolyl isomerase [Allosphingosinicella sp.]|jgi:peptidyl-prolyl cis-trans isomerase SurA|nr:peptidylprolyl isomerase [Allosphingosinicella sp.]